MSNKIEVVTEDGEIKEISLIEEHNLPDLLGNGGLDRIIDELEKNVLSVVIDASDADGRKEARSLARKISSSRTAISTAAADLNRKLQANVKTKVKLINQSKTSACDRLAILRDKVKQPAVDYDNRIKEDEQRKQWALDYDEATEENDYRNEVALFRAEKEAAELEKIRVQEEKEAKEELDRIKEQARIDAEQVAKAEIEAAKQAKIDAELKAKQAEIERIEAKEKAELAAMEAKFEAERLKKEAKEKAEKDKQEAVKQAELKAKLDAEQAEKDRFEREIEKKRQARIKAANIEHQRAINANALDDLISNGIDAKIARKLLELVIKNKVRKLTINY